MDRTKLSKVESGARRVTASELARIADRLGQRIEWFVDPEPPIIASRRNTKDPGAPSPLLEDLAQRLARHVEFLDAHDRRLTLPELEPLPHPSSPEEIEFAAASARERMSIDPLEPAHQLSRLVARIGLLAFSLDAGEGGADAVSIALQRGGVAVVNGSLRVGRRRLALAHELGHHVFADEYALDWHVGEADAANWEGSLDRFARAFLLPAEATRILWTDLMTAHDSPRTAAVVLASRYRVDMATLARRLVELRILNGAQSRAVGEARTARADFVEHGLVSSDELAPPELARPYEESVLRLYREEIISDSRALDLLLDTYQYDDLPDLPRGRANIWEFVS